MIRGETVEVWAPQAGDPDEFNTPGPVSWHLEATVENALVAPGGTDDLGAARPQGDRIDLTIHMPRTHTAALRGKRVRVRGAMYEVRGDPVAYTPENTPGPWDRPVPVVRVDG